ncbi:MAG: CBS domain-containing protein [Deltaproteobacteria bacterium]
MIREVISIRPEAHIDEVVALLVKHRIHAVAVVDASGTPIGVVSQTDLVLARQGNSLEATRSLRVEEVMTPGCLTCGQTTPLFDAVTLMTRNRVHRLIVTERDGAGERMIGILSMTDIVNKTLGFRER